MPECVFIDENGIVSELRYNVTEEAPDLCGRQYGIIVEMTADGEESDICKIRNCYFRREEAEQIAQLLCEYQVTPCTAREVIKDLYDLLQKK